MWIVASRSGCSSTIRREQVAVGDVALVEDPVPDEGERPGQQRVEDHRHVTGLLEGLGRRRSDVAGASGDQDLHPSSVARTGAPARRRSRRSKPEARLRARVTPHLGTAGERLHPYRAHSSPGSPDRTGCTSPRPCWPRGTTCTGSSAARTTPSSTSSARLIPDVTLHNGDLTDLSSLIRALRASDPEEVYNLGAVSNVAYSWANVSHTTDVTAKGTLTILEAIRLHAEDDLGAIRFYQASSSEMFGKVREVPQTERTQFWPRSPYGVSKVFGHYMTINYRESYGMHASSRHPLQPRVAAARRRVRHPQDQPGRGPDLARAAGRARAGQPRGRARLGLRRRLRRGHVAHAPAAAGRRLRDRHGRDPLDPRLPRRGVRARRGRATGAATSVRTRT